jgi:hypothetical protein
MNDCVPHQPECEQGPVLGGTAIEAERELLRVAVEVRPVNSQIRFYPLPLASLLQRADVFLA